MCAVIADLFALRFAHHLHRASGHHVRFQPASPLLATRRLSALFGMFTKDQGPLWRRMMTVLERAGKFNKMPPIPELKGMVLEFQVLQLKLAQVEVIANHGNGLVKAIATCDGKLSRVEISGRAKELPREGLEEIVSAAVNDAIEKARLR